MIPDPASLTYIEPFALSEAIESPQKPVVVDVRTPAPFEAVHIPGAINVCVYLVSFLDDMSKIAADKAAPLVVYGESGDFRAGELAAGRLRDFGYRNISVLKGGISGWKAAGQPVEEDDCGTPGMPVGDFSVDPEQSKVRWIGRNLLNQHDGMAPVKSGFIRVGSDGGLQGGEIVVDMTGLTCGDIEDPKLNQALIQHMMHEDFFKVDVFPDARFAIEAVAAIEGGGPGRPNVEVSGVMTIRGRRIQRTIHAYCAGSDNGYVFQAQFDFDRTDHGSFYGSGKFFETLGMHMVNDLVYVQVVAVFPVTR